MKTISVEDKYQLLMSTIIVEEKHGETQKIKMVHSMIPKIDLKFQNILKYLCLFISLK
jgi:hypothetical protein